ncbi:MAG TPA: response regulator [Rubrivivax sp.]|nr:response regulator [Rubrivivax sp.]
MTPEIVRVLVVDDEADTRESLKFLLELDGYTVDSAASSKEAWALMEQQLPDCVILDLHMPGGNGRELTQRIRDTHGSGIVVLVLTGSTLASDQTQVEHAGADYVMHKPLDLERLRKILPRIEN